jgi:hypothetical protein
MKKCGKCQKVKERSKFPRNRHRSDGLGSWCLLCHRERMRELRAERAEAEVQERGEAAS